MCKIEAVVGDPPGVATAADATKSNEAPPAALTSDGEGLIFPIGGSSVPALDHDDALAMMEEATVPSMATNLGC